jgi:hypothetical protein
VYLGILDVFSRMSSNKIRVRHWFGAFGPDEQADATTARLRARRMCFMFESMRTMMAVLSHAHGLSSTEVNATNSHGVYKSRVELRNSSLFHERVYTDCNNIGLYIETLPVPTIWERCHFSTSRYRDALLSDRSLPI